jgi:hypothetical protein
LPKWIRMKEKLQPGDRVNLTYNFKVETEEKEQK